MKLFMLFALVWLSHVDGASIWGSISNAFGFGDDGFDNPVQAVADVSQECVHYANIGSCEFYDCLERRFPCGENSYNVKFGKHFCSKIARHIHLFTPAGQRFMNETNVCLTSHYSDLYQNSSATCERIREIGVNGIIRCQDVQTAEYPTFCRFVAENTRAYWRIFDTTDMTKILTLNEPRVWRLLIEQGFECGTARLQKGVQGAIQRLKRMWDNLFG
ncbi:hypothetical protein CHS0354_030485 [Potamilus streckersoni]|uniref:Uncharacterized protein n=1 Tax=Potamilus streckersoni TaxID=2493646 RepID=A0AAE0VHT2_9BIVA|nr:hypothetical protein CHS0354_030485 [Potamilus streckersoni]